MDDSGFGLTTCELWSMMYGVGLVSEPWWNAPIETQLQVEQLANAINESLFPAHQAYMQKEVA